MNSKVYAWVPSKDAHGKLLSLINESVSDFVPGHEYEFDCVAVLSNGIVVVDKIGREHRILKSRLSQGLNSYKIGQKITVLAMQKYDDIFLSERAHSMRILSEISRKTEELDEIDDDVNYEEIDHEIDELTIEI